MCFERKRERSEPDLPPTRPADRDRSDVSVDTHGRIWLTYLGGLSLFMIGTADDPNHDPDCVGKWHGWSFDKPTPIAGGHVFGEEFEDLLTVTKREADRMDEAVLRVMGGQTGEQDPNEDLLASLRRALQEARLRRTAASVEDES